jgi:hypothetical protein
MTTTTATLTPIISKQFEMEVKEGLAFILNHLDDLWPRMISTYATRGGQRLVNNMYHAFASNFLDCRISAYPKYTDYYINRTGIAPSVLLVDVDRAHFETAELFDITTTRSYSNFHTILGSRPTQLWIRYSSSRHLSSVPIRLAILYRAALFQCAYSTAYSHV